MISRISSSSIHEVSSLLLQELQSFIASPDLSRFLPANDIRKNSSKAAITIFMLSSSERDALLDSGDHAPELPVVNCHEITIE